MGLEKISDSTPQYRICFGEINKKTLNCELWVGWQLNGLLQQLRCIIFQNPNRS